MMAPFEECPRFSKCNVNVCPLDPAKDEKDQLPEDERCTLPKVRRMRIAAKYPELISWRGLWPRELASLRHWESLTPEQQQAIRERGRRALTGRLRADSEGQSSSEGQDSGA